MESRNNHGGRRPGAGRPKGDSKIYSFRCPRELAEQLEQQKNRTEFIRNSLTAALDRQYVTPAFPGDAVPAGAVRPMRLPFFDAKVVAGFPVPLDSDERAQDINVLSLLCPHPESSYLVRVNGNSMTDAGVQSGDIVIVDKSRRNPSPKEIAVCELNGEFTLKRFIEEDGCGWLVPANPDYPRLRITDNDDFSIWGTVTYIIHKPRE